MIMQPGLDDTGWRVNSTPTVHVIIIISICKLWLAYIIIIVQNTVWPTSIVYRVLDSWSTDPGFGSHCADEYGHQPWASCTHTCPPTNSTILYWSNGDEIPKLGSEPSFWCHRQTWKEMQGASPLTIWQWHPFICLSELMTRFITVHEC